MGLVRLFVWHAAVIVACVRAQGIEREREVTGRQQVDPEKDSLLTRCFDKWGCFSIGEPFFSALRPVSLFPVHPDVLDAQFLLVTRTTPDVFQKLRPGNNASFAQSSFDPLRSVKLIVHGFTESGYQDWVKDLIRELLTSDDYNVISVDWRQGAAQSYPQAVANTRVLGLVIADFIDYLQRKYRISPSDIHIIGHNLGAHAAGYAGEQLPRLGRISALDPAGPYFENTESRVRLDPNDALFVDVIHSDGTVSTRVPGMVHATGHVDFYPTPGWRRPGCPLQTGSYADVNRFRRCNGVRAPDLFTESVNMDCPFYGFACDSYGNFSAGHCYEGCGTDMSKCAPMGFKADEWLRFSSYEPVTMFLETGIAEPYCRYHYHVSVLLSGNEDSRRHLNETGLLFVRLTGTKGRTTLVQATPSVSVFIPGTSVEFVLSAPNLGRLLRVDALWSASPGPHPHPYRPDFPQIYAHSFRITNLETSYREVFCGRDEPMNPEHVRTFFGGGVC
uniref:U54-Liphistoxin-Lsp1a_1 n=1 Tax=Liphistius sp. SGP-2016 TaxID=1905180 RepID=A0A4Q8K3J2_9ARAC